MKVSVITLHRVYNYGSALQAFATQKIFEGFGFETEIIDYLTPDRTLIKTFLKPGADGALSGTKLLKYRIAKIGSLFLKELTFGRFVKRYLNLSKRYIVPEDLDRDPPIADVYVTGSDQVWNSDYNGVDRGFYLDFIPDEANRIAFVASFGKDELDDLEKDEITSYLKKYKALSVREDSAVKIIKALGIDNVVQLIDPTLQLPKDDWLKIASNRLVKEPYLVLMLLYNEDNHATEYARMIANKKGLKLVKLSWEMRKPALIDKLFTHRTPEDFLSLIANADFVVTNSFHGLAFSINFSRQFIIVPRKEYNSRIVSLLKLTGLESRLVQSTETAIQCSEELINYQPVDAILFLERKKAREYIASNI